MIWSRALFIVASAAYLSRAEYLFASSYGGLVYTISLEDGPGAPQLSIQDSNAGCAPSPAWLSYDRNANVLYCLDEGLLQNNGSVSSFSVGSDGGLTLVERKLVPPGPSGSVIYSKGSVERLGISLYNGSALEIMNISSQGIMSPVQQFFFQQEQPGNTPAQTAPHEHQILLDPTGQYLILNAWGEDEIQVFYLDPTGAVRSELPSSSAVPGSAPRHGTFWSPQGRNDTSELFYFLLGEISSGLDTYRVTYNTSGPGMSFKLVASTTTYGPGQPPEGNGPAEIHVSPDNRFVVVSNRNTSTTRHKSLDNPFSPVQEFWDNLANFEPMPNGSLAFRGLIPSGGGFPRNFAFNDAGDQVAVTLRSEARVVIFDRNVDTGDFGDIVANITLEGELNAVRWAK